MGRTPSAEEKAYFSFIMGLKKLRLRPRINMKTIIKQ